MEKINIFVISHKQLNISDYPGRKIIYVGKKHGCVADNVTTFVDNTGDNISDLNPYYCELTAMYWVWKNAPKCEYVGFEHYSRNFYKNIFKKADINYLYNKAKKCDFIHIPKWSHIKSCGDFWKKHEGKFLYPILENSIKNVMPDYFNDWCKSMSMHSISYCNMFICKWNYFDKYMQYIFKILNDCFKNIQRLSDVEKSRSIGFMAERLFDTYILHNNLRDKSCFIKIKKH